MSVRERKPFVGGNWKMNGSYESIDAIIKFLVEGNISPNIGHCYGRLKIKTLLDLSLRGRSGSAFGIPGSRETEITKQHRSGCPKLLQM